MRVVKLNYDDVGTADIKVFRDGQCMAVYHGEPIIDIMTCIDYEDMIEDIESFIWKRKQSIESKEVRNILTQVVEDLYAKYVDGEDI